MSKKSEDFYFDNFTKSAACASEAAEFLKDVLVNFNAYEMQDKLKELHDIENRADGVKHAMTEEIVRAFITPIERDDITNLSQNLDDVTDSIEDVLIHIFLNNITEIREDCIEFAELIIRCCGEVKLLTEEFQNFRKSKTLSSHIIEINRLEEDGDRLYIAAMRTLHTTSKNAIEIIAWREIYAFLENCCDKCEDVADIVETIAIVNS